VVFLFQYILVYSTRGTRRGSLSKQEHTSLSKKEHTNMSLFEGSQEGSQLDSKHASKRACVWLARFIWSLCILTDSNHIGASVIQKFRRIEVLNGKSLYQKKVLYGVCWLASMERVDWLTIWLKASYLLVVY
jgi:hypothetical protein